MFRNTQAKALKPLLASNQVEIKKAHHLDLNLSPELVLATSTDPTLKAIFKNDIFKENQKISLVKFTALFSAIHQHNQQDKLSNKNLVVAQFKLAVMEAIRNKLLSFNRRKLKPSVKLPPQNSLAKTITYNTLLLTTVTKDLIGNYLGGGALLTLVLGAGSPFIFAGSLFFSLLNTALSYSLKSSVLKHGLDYYSDERNPSKLLDTHAKQITALKEIYDFLNDSLVSKALDYSDYKLYLDLKDLFSENMKLKKEELAQYEESSPKKAFRYMATAFTTFMSGCASYFLSKSLLGTFAPHYLGSFIGWGIIGLSVMSSLAQHIFQLNGMVTLVNPDHEQYSTVKEELNHLESLHAEYQTSYQEILQEKKELEARPNSPTKNQLKVGTESKTHPSMQRCFTIQTKSSYFTELNPQLNERKSADPSAPRNQPNSP